AAQFAAVDVGEAAEALVSLFADPDLRARMGAAGAVRAREVFDWRVVVPQYQALWAELGRRRMAAPPQPPRLAGSDPWRMDPFTMFAAYPTAALALEDVAALARPLADGEAADILARALLPAAAPHLPTQEEAMAVLAMLGVGPRAVAEITAQFA